MTSGGDAFLARRAELATVGSTNDVVRGWLDEGTPEVCLAVADVQTAGRGRGDRTWTAPAGRALLLSLGFRPTWLAPERAWRLGAIVALAMSDAAEEVAGLRDGAVRLKWPNDLVVEARDGRARKLAGVLGETDGLGTADPRAIVGIGINVDWAAADFPAELAADMSSLREASGGRPVDRSALLEGFISRLEARTLALRDGMFDIAGWIERQLTTGRELTIATADGRVADAFAVGVDALSGALIVADAAAPDGERQILSGEVIQVRLAGSVEAPATGRRGGSAGSDRAGV